MPMEAEGTPLSARIFCATASILAEVSGGSCWADASVVAARRVAVRRRRMMGKDNIALFRYFFEADGILALANIFTMSFAKPSDAMVPSKAVTFPEARTMDVRLSTMTKVWT